MTFNLNNINKPTPSEWSKFGLACIAVATFIAGYGLTIESKWLGFVGLAIGVVGTFISTMFAENKK